MITFNPYRNDWDPDTTALIFSGYDLPGHGILNKVSDSTFTYQPGPDFFGDDSFYYYIQDEYTQLDTGIVYISVSNIPDKPGIFHLLSPADNFATDNNWEITFKWASSLDADNDTLSYSMKIFNDNADTTLSAGSDTSVVFDGSSFFTEGTSYNWTAWVEDTMFTVYADTFMFDVSLLVSVNEGQPRSPLTFKLDQNFPNPFNPATVITYQLAKTSAVELKIFNILGEEIVTLVSGEQQAGNYSVPFDAGQLAAGVYFYSLQAGDFIAHRKMILLK
jgi:hypothetical protein